MARFIKIPVEVEAITFDEFISWTDQNNYYDLNQRIYQYGSTYIKDETGKYMVRCMNGEDEVWRVFEPGHYLVTDPDGKIFPCVAHIFESVYMPKN